MKRSNKYKGFTDDNETEGNHVESQYQYQRVVEKQQDRKDSLVETKQSPPSIKEKRNIIVKKCLKDVNADSVMRMYEELSKIGLKTQQIDKIVKTITSIVPPKDSKVEITSETATFANNWGIDTSNYIVTDDVPSASATAASSSTAASQKSDNSATR